MISKSSPLQSRLARATATHNDPASGERERESLEAFQSLLYYHRQNWNLLLVERKNIIMRSWRSTPQPLVAIQFARGRRGRKYDSWWVMHSKLIGSSRRREIYYTYIFFTVQWILSKQLAIIPQSLYMFSFKRNSQVAAVSFQSGNG